MAAIDGLELIEKYFPSITDDQKKKFEQLLPLYKEWNEKINVISRKDMDAFYLHHVLHSLAIAKVVSFSAGQTVLDVGTGGGFPGVPLAILFPETKFTLVDSIGKKIKVVNEVKQALGLKNISAHHTRMEELHGIFYDAIVSRAVAPAAQLVAWTKHLMKKNGHWYFLKGGDLANEVEALQKPATLKSVSDFFTEEYFVGKVVMRINSSQ